MEVRFEDVTEDNFQVYSPLFMSAEAEFPEGIRSDAEDFRFMLEKQFDPVAIVAYAESEFAGFAIGSLIDSDEVSDYGFPLNLSGKKIIYFFDITLRQKFQGNGLGKQLFCKFMLSAKEKGYDVVLGHYRPGGSASMIKKLGGIEVGLEKEWESTGEDYYAYALSLATVQEEALVQMPRENLIKCPAVLPGKSSVAAPAAGALSA